MFGAGCIEDGNVASQTVCILFNFLSIAILPLIATFPLAFALPHGNDLFETQASSGGNCAESTRSSAKC